MNEERKTDIVKYQISLLAVKLLEKNVPNRCFSFPLPFIIFSAFSSEIQMMMESEQQAVHGMEWL